MFGDTTLMDVPTGSRRINPVDQLQRAQADLNRLFAGLRFERLTELPLLNLWTSADGAIVAVEVPGVAPEDLDITVRHETATLRGSRPPEPVGDDTIVQRQERATGPFARSVILPFRIDADKASARFERGIVTLTLPRPEDDKPRQIKVARS